MRETPIVQKKTLLLIVGILLIATNLRAPFTSLAPLLEMIRDSFGLTAAQAGLLQTLPLLAFAVFSPFAAGIAHRLGMEKSLFYSLLVIVLGICLRSYAGLSGLYGGTLLIGLGIAIGNVLLPGILKRDLPHKAASLTGLYALTMGLAAALGSATMIPIAHNLGAGWQNSLLATIVFPLIALVIWLPQLTRTTVNSTDQKGSQSRRSTGVWSAGLAWQVSLFFGLNSFIYYIIVAWLPAILQNIGYSVTEAGSLHGLLQLSTALPGFFIGPVLSKLRDQRILGVLFALMGALGLTGLLLIPSIATVWVTIIGFCTGAGVILGLAFISLRSSNSAQAAALSGMAQSVGYLLAAGGPPVVGLIHDRIGGWTLPLVGCIALSFILAVLGYLAGRARQLPNHNEPETESSSTHCAMTTGDKYESR
ncbi:MFS transporter [Raoultella planticola]|uniref:MFS transporter n=1 Tax=Raoultella planticola TaxID=575 RepID=A0A443VP69_RAOPL|nr:CynX/NimT family MFS transporter [Raoultella planticola]RWT23322.1 MFS transporter [Raoultella planticola]